jgi:dUTP pyrophosphatase
MTDKNSTVKFLKIRNVKSPDRANQFDAGIDFYVPKFEADFVKALKEKNPEVFNTNSKQCCCASAIYVSGGTLTISDQYSGKIEYNLEDTNNSMVKFDEEKGLNYFLLMPHQRVLIPSGIKSRMAQPNRALIAANKSGVATKHGIVFGAQVVDYLYKGEIHISVINTSTKVVRIYEDMKLIQFLETPIFNSDINVVENVNPDEFYKGMSDERGEGGFGSSDKK